MRTRRRADVPTGRQRASRRRPAPRATARTRTGTCYLYRGSSTSSAPAPLHVSSTTTTYVSPGHRLLVLHSGSRRGGREGGAGDGRGSLWHRVSRHPRTSNGDNGAPSDPCCENGPAAGASLHSCVRSQTHATLMSMSNCTVVVMLPSPNVRKIRSTSQALTHATPTPPPFAFSPPSLPPSLPASLPPPLPLSFPHFFPPPLPSLHPFPPSPPSLPPEYNSIVRLLPLRRPLVDVRMPQRGRKQHARWPQQSQLLHFLLPRRLSGQHDGKVSRQESGGRLGEGAGWWQGRILEHGMWDVEG